MSAAASTSWHELPKVARAIRPDAQWPVDPYLLWAELTHYAGIRRGVLPFMVELSQPLREAIAGFPEEQKDLFASPMAWAPWSRFVSLRAPFEERTGLLDMLSSGLLMRLQLGAARGEAPRLPPVDFIPVHPFLSADTIAVIDDGCCLAHERFRSRDGDSRFLIVWDQSPDARPGEYWRQYRKLGPVVDYGYELGSKELKRALLRIDGFGQSPERAFYDDVLHRPNWGRNGRVHGAGVLDLVDRPMPNTPPNPLPLIFVQLPDQTVADTSGGSLGNYVLDAARYIAARTPVLVGDAVNWAATINISLGSIAGPHDGTTMTERALDELVGQSSGKVRLVMAAGNTAGLRVHATQRVSRGKPGRFCVMVPPDNARASFVEVWIRGDADALAFQVKHPSSTRKKRSMAHLRTGTANVLRNASGEVVAAAILCRRVAQGEVGTMLLLAISPTATTPDSPASLAEPGVWEIVAKSSRGKEIVLDAWVERNDTVIAPRRTQQSHFVGTDPFDPDDRAVNDRSTLSSIANGECALVVGAYDVAEMQVAAYSANGPVLGAPDRVVPQLYGPSDASPWRPGVQVSGFYSGTHSRLSGTSAAAPQVTRWVAQGRPAKALGMVAPYVDPEVSGSSLPVPATLPAVLPDA